MRVKGAAGLLLKQMGLLKGGGKSSSAIRKSKYTQKKSKDAMVG